jgi:hypothetical protein
MIQGSTQPLKKRVSRIFLEVKDGRRVTLTACPLQVCCIENVRRLDNSQACRSLWYVDEDSFFIRFSFLRGDKIFFLPKCARREKILSSSKLVFKAGADMELNESFTFCKILLGCGVLYFGR